MGNNVFVISASCAWYFWRSVPPRDALKREDAPKSEDGGARPSAVTPAAPPKPGSESSVEQTVDSTPHGKRYGTKSVGGPAGKRKVCVQSRSSGSDRQGDHKNPTELSQPAPSANMSSTQSNRKSNGQPQEPRNQLSGSLPVIVAELDRYLDKPC